MKDPDRAALAARAVEVDDLRVGAAVEDDQADDGSLGILGSAADLSNGSHDVQGSDAI